MSSPTQDEVSEAGTATRPHENRPPSSPAANDTPPSPADAPSDNEAKPSPSSDRLGDGEEAEEAVQTLAEDAVAHGSLSKAENDGEATTAAATGMRREWNFTLTFAHKQARVLLQCSPQWEPTFIDPDLIDQVRQLDRDVRHTPLIPCLRYTDFSAVVGAGGRGAGRRLTAGRSSTGARLSTTSNLAVDEEAHGGESDDGAPLFRDSYGDDAGDWWLEKAKHVEVFYSHLPPDMTLDRYCKDSVHHVLKDPQIVAVDQETDRTRLHVGQKLNCPHRLGGHASFHFRCRLQNRAQLVDDSVYAIGTIVQQRGYLVTIRCAEEEELEGYLARLFLPAFTVSATADSGTSPWSAAAGLKLQLDAEVQYAEATSAVLAAQQERYGELRYVDRDAAISFTLPMHSMRIRPDFSPAKTVGVGSIACMTIEVNVYERLIDDSAIAELSGMPRFKVNQVVLCLDVEDVARMGYPRVISTEEYSRLKTERLMEVFADAKSVGQSTTVAVGGRVGRSRTTTFLYEPLQGLVKDMNVSTLVDNRGVTVLYLTRLGGGAFDTHLYLFQQLLASISYLPVNGASEVRAAEGTIKDRHRVPNTRLLEPDLPRAYAKGCAAAVAAAAKDAEEAIAGHVRLDETPASPLPSSGRSREGSDGLPQSPLSAGLTPAAQEMLQRHIALLRQSNDGRVEGPTVVVNVPLEEGGTSAEEGGRGGLGGPHTPLEAAEDDSQTEGEASEGSAGPAGSDGDNDDTIDPSTTQRGVSSEKAATATVSAEDNESSASADVHSHHSRSLISVSSIPHLRTAGDAEPQDADRAVGVERQAIGAGTTNATPRDGSVDRGPDATGDPFADLAPLQTRHSEDAHMTSVPRLTANRSRRVSLAEDSEREGSGDHQAGGGGGARGGRLSVSLSRSGVEATRRSSVSFAAEDGVEDASVAGGPSSRGASQHGEDDTSNAARRASRETAIREALADADEDATFQGSSLRDVYTRCCELQQCKPNSYLLRKLPTDPRLTASVEELDLTSNYLGHNGVVAVLNLLEYLPQLRSLYLNDTSLDNTDVEHISRALVHHPSVEAVHLDNNPHITLPATRDLTKLVRGNRRLKLLSLYGTKLGDLVIQRLEKEIEARQTLLPSANKGTSSA